MWIEQAAWNKSSLLLQDILQNTQPLQLLMKVIKTEAEFLVMCDPSMNELWVT